MICNILTNAQFCGYWRGLRQLQKQLLFRTTNVCNLGGLFPFRKRYTIIILSLQYHKYILDTSSVFFSDTTKSINVAIFRLLSRDNISNS